VDRQQRFLWHDVVTLTVNCYAFVMWPPCRSCKAARAQAQTTRQKLARMQMGSLLLLTQWLTHVQLVA
jgi:hypothetical protein